MRILVVGAGATGGYFGGLLARAGRDVTFLVRPHRAALLRDHGLSVRTPSVTWAIQPTVVTPAELTGPFDLILLSVKAYSLTGAIDDAAPAVGPATMILPGLNGLAHLPLLADRFGDRAVLGGLMIVSTTLDNDGRIVQFQPGLNELAFGDRQDPDSRRIVTVETVLEGAGFATRRSRQIEADMWAKWVTLAAAGAMTCLMRGAVGEIVGTPGGPGFADRVIDECADVAAASGFPIREAQRQWTDAVLTDPASGFTSSMYRDLAAGNRTGVEQIIGDLVHRATALGVEVPLLSLAYLNLSIYERRLDRQPTRTPV